MKPIDFDGNSSMIACQLRAGTDILRRIVLDQQPDLRVFRKRDQFFHGLDNVRIRRCRICHSRSGEDANLVDAENLRGGDGAAKIVFGAAVLSAPIEISAGSFSAATPSTCLRAEFSGVALQLRLGQKGEFFLCFRGRCGVRPIGVRDCFRKCDGVRSACARFHP